MEYKVDLRAAWAAENAVEAADRAAAESCHWEAAWAAENAAESAARAAGWAAEKELGNGI